MANAKDKKNTGKEMQKAYKKRSEECFGANENIDYYDPDTYEGEEDRLLDIEPDANFTSTVTSPTKSSSPQYRTCLV